MWCLIKSRYLKRPMAYREIWQHLSSTMQWHLTHWGRVTHISVSKPISIGSDNGLPPGRRQAIIWANAGVLWSGPWGTYIREILIENNKFSFKKTFQNIALKVAAISSPPPCVKQTWLPAYGYWNVHSLIKMIDLFFIFHFSCLGVCGTAS